MWAMADARRAHPEQDIRLLEDVEHLRACEALQQTVWSVADREVVPLSQLRAAQHAGGLVAGAFDGDVLVGFVYGFPARDEARSSDVGMHSHMLGVAPQARGRGVGQALKWFQRRWCLEHGYGWVSWTFDPLQAGNANLNLEHLAAYGVAYYRDFYGELGGDLAGEVATDRLLAWWPLATERVAARAPDADEAEHSARSDQGGSRGSPRGGAPGSGPSETAREDLDGIPKALDERDGEPGETALGLTAPAVAIAAPSSARRLFTHEAARARRWREAQRAAFGAYLGRGYMATRFVDGSYVLERNHELQNGVDA